LDIVNIDLCGPTRTKELDGVKYFMLLIDDYTKMTWVLFLKNNSEDFECFKIFKSLIENESDLKIKCLRSNNGGEFNSNEFSIFCEEWGIKI
jgi:hypothetical protein